MEEKSISDISKILNDDKISSIVEKLLERASSDNVSFYKSHLHEIIEDADIEKNRFLQHHHSIWGECFEASRVMYIIAVEGAEAFCHYVTDNIPIDTRESKQFTFLALQHIHGRVCQQFAEVLCLMENGFADGAYARWRSMFELCCTATFISEQGEQIAKQYQKNYSDRIVLACVDGKLRELSKVVKASGKISFLTMTDRDGKRTYRRSSIWERNHNKNFCCAPITMSC